MLTDDLEDLFENAPCGYLAMQEDGSIARANATFCAWIEQSPAEIVGKRFPELLDIAGQIYYETHFAPLIRIQGFFNEVALNLVTGTGGRLPVLVNAVQRRTPEGEHLFTRITIFNSTERRRYEAELLKARGEAESASRMLAELNGTLEARIATALAKQKLTEEALRQRERSLQLAVSAGGLGLWAWSADDADHVWATEEVRTKFGLPSEDTLAAASLAALVLPEDAERVNECLRSAKQNAKEHELEFRIKTPDGSTRWILVRGRAEFEPAGDLASIRGVVRDVTERHRRLQEIDELEAKVAHSSRVMALGHLSSALAHELRQPLVAIQFNIEAADLILQDLGRRGIAELQEILSEIRRDDLRAAEVIDRMRTLMNRHELELVPISIVDFVQDAVALVRSDAIRRGVMLKVDLESNPLTVRGDRVQLSQVMINLLVNAMDAMSTTAPALRQLSVRAHRTDGGWIEISVSDHGTGISAEKMPTIFEPFFTTKPSGMGIGLSVCRMIIDSHGGKLWAENNATAGATFRFSLPPYP
jgi:PAS domain S-box-containing protein